MHLLDQQYKKYIRRALLETCSSLYGLTFYKFLLFQMQKVEKLKSLCLQYAAATQWLISSSIDIPKLDDSSDGLLGSEKLKPLKLRSPSQAQKVMIKDPTVTESVL